MVWNDIVGLVLAGAGAALFLSAQRRGFPPATRRPEAVNGERDGNAGPPPDELSQRLARRVQHERSRRKRQARWGLGLIVAASLFGIVPALLRELAPAGMPPFAQPSPAPGSSTPPVPTPPAATPPTASPPGGSREHLSLWAIAAPGIAAMLVGGAMLVASRSTWVRAAGTATLLSGLTANGYLIKEVKVSDIFKLETTIEKLLALEVKVDKQKPPHPPEFGSERLALFEGFESGVATLPDMDARAAAVCTRWRERAGPEPRGVVLVVGSTDRVELGPVVKRRYGTNVGLARARAEVARQKLEACGIRSGQLMTLVTGPRRAHDDRRASGPDPGVAEDRSVEVWALWSVPAGPRQ